MRYILVALMASVALCLFASTAGAYKATTFLYGPEASVRLLTTQVTNIGTAGFCMDMYQDTTANVAAQACDIDIVNEIVWMRNAQVTEVKVAALVAPDAGDYCKFTIEVGTVAKATATTTLTQLVSTVQSLPLVSPLNLAEGDLVGIMVTDGDGCADGTSPTYQVELWGRYVSDDAF